jgi:tetratricopeptide (TPR) repeat protein
MAADYGGAQQISGALLNAPILWAALAIPLLARRRRWDRRFGLLALSAAWVAVSSLGVLSLFFGAVARYQFEYVPALALLAAFGVFTLEGAAGGARWALRCAWIPALLFSAAFTVLYGINRVVTDHATSGLIYLASRDYAGAQHEFDVARMLAPRNPGSRVGEGAILLFRGRLGEAQAALEGVTRDSPDDALGHYFLGAVYSGEGRKADAVAEFEAAHRLDPGNPGINKGLASALAPGR